MAEILIKNGQNGWFLKTLWPKLQHPSTMVIYITMKHSKCLEGSVFLLTKSSFASEASFAPKLTISAINSKLPVNNLSFFISVKLTTLLPNKHYCG